MPASEIQSYQAAMQWISDRIDYEKIRPLKSSRHFRLERMSVLLQAIGSPQQRIPVVHLAGTKGKGTTAAILHSILVEAGLKTGLFISPHLHRFEERMRVDHQLPSPEFITELVAELVERLNFVDSDLIEGGPTYFEIATLLAWMLFDRQNVDLAVLETGLGGRLDCTNACHPILTGITSIGLDHTEILGDTLPEIAAEKAGIIKSGVACITGADQPEVLDVLQSVANENGSTLLPFEQGCELREISFREGLHQTFSLLTPAFVLDRLRLPLLGRHQAKNAGLAIYAADQLSGSFSQITPAVIRAGVEAVCWPLRFEILEAHGRTVVLDAAHNPDSVKAFVRTFRECFPDETPVVLFGGSQDKDVKRMLEHLTAELPCRSLILSRYSSSQRACDPEDLRQYVKTSSTTTVQVMTTESAEAALEQAWGLATPDAPVCVLGSIFFSAEVREILSK